MSGMPNMSSLLPPKNGPADGGLRRNLEGQLTEQEAKNQNIQRRENDTLVIRMEFEPHSQMYDIINLGIELDLILDDEREGQKNIAMVAEGMIVDAQETE